MEADAADPVAAYLAEARATEQAATDGPWWFDEDEMMWRLHGVHATIPAQMDGLIPPQVVNHQILKAPKSGTPYAEYWPSDADAAFIIDARTLVPALLGAVEAVLAEAAKAEHGALRWHPLPVPEWIPLVRSAISSALLGKEGTPDV